jgi:uroporphyrinogen decarboxylase
MAERKARMTDRERVEAILRREKPDRVPIWPYFAQGFACVYTRTPISDAYNKPEAALAAQRKTALDFDWVFIPMMGYAAMGGWEFGGDIKWPSGEFSQAPSISRHAVSTPDEAMNLKMPDVKNSGIVPFIMEFGKLSSQEWLDNEPFNVVSAGGGGVFTIAGNIPGPDTLCKWIRKKPEVVHHLMRLATDYTVALSQYWKDTFGTEGVLPLGGEPTSANQLISASQFEEFAFPYIKEAQEKILAMGFKTTHMHVCGEQNDNMPFWAQIPFGDPGLLSFGHEVELETAARYFPNDVIVGNVNPTIIQTGTPDDVYKATKKNVEDGMAKCPGGYIFGPGCELPPMASIENIKAMNKAVNDAGWYD